MTTKTPRAPDANAVLVTPELEEAQREVATLRTNYDLAMRELERLAALVDKQRADEVSIPRELYDIFKTFVPIMDRVRLASTLLLSFNESDSIERARVLMETVR